MADSQRFDTTHARAATRFATEVANGGSSYHVLSGQFLNVGVDQAHMVGGHPFAGTNTRIPETIHDKPITAADAHAHFMRTAINTGGDVRAYAGGWAEDGKAVLDASTRVSSKAKAVPLAQGRNEREIFNAKAIESYKVPKSRKGGPVATAPEPEVDPSPTVSQSARGTVKINGNRRQPARAV